MPDKSDLGLGESHETIRGGERVLIRRARPQDMALYPDFLRDISAEDLRLEESYRCGSQNAVNTDLLASSNDTYHHRGKSHFIIRGLRDQKNWYQDFNQALLI